MKKILLAICAFSILPQNLNAGDQMGKTQKPKLVMSYQTIGVTKSARKNELQLLIISQNEKVKHWRQRIQETKNMVHRPMIILDIFDPIKFIGQVKEGRASIDFLDFKIAPNATLTQQALELEQKLAKTTLMSINMPLLQDKYLEKAEQAIVEFETKFSALDKSHAYETAAKRVLSRFDVVANHV